MQGRAGFHHYPTAIAFDGDREPQLHLERDPMSTIEERVKKIVVEQLGVRKKKSPTAHRSSMTWALTRWTPSSW